MAIAVSIDGHIVPPEEARVSVFDHGFLFGDSVYEVVRTRRGVLVTLTEHMARFRASAGAIHFELPWSDAEMGERIRGAVAAGGNPESYVRVIATRGVGEISLLPDTCTPGFIVIVRPLPEPPAAVARDGIAVILSRRPRNDRRALSPGAKTGNYLNNVLALIEARKAGGDDALLANPSGILAEATTSNLFFVKDGVVHTPALDSGILAGITRDLLIRVLRTEGVSVEEGSYPPEILREASEVFLTSTIRGVAPVVRIDGEPVGDGWPGPMAARLVGLYFAELDRLADEASAS